MTRRSVALLASFLMVLGAASWGLGGEKRERPRKKREPKRPAVSQEDYLRLTDELTQVASELGTADDAAAQKLRERAQKALRELKVYGKQAERILQAQDPKSLAGSIKMYVYRSVMGKLSYARRKFIEGKPELAEAYKQFQERRRQIDKEMQEFYAKLRTMSPELDALEKTREQFEAERKKQFEEMRKKRMKGRERKPRKKRKE